MRLLASSLPERPDDATIAKPTQGDPTRRQRAPVPDRRPLRHHSLGTALALCVVLSALLSLLYLSTSVVEDKLGRGAVDAF